MTAKEMIQSLPQRFNKEAAAGLDSVFHFDISGPSGGKFTVIVKNGECQVLDQLSGEAACTVSASDADYTEIMEGRQNAMTAFMFGKIKVSNLSELMKMKDVFKFNF